MYNNIFIMKKIDKLFDNIKVNLEEIKLECKENNLPNFLSLVEKVIISSKSSSSLPELSSNELSQQNNKIKVFLTCNWTDSKKICDTWNKMSNDNNYSWNNIQIVWNEPYDYVCVINQPHDLNMKIDTNKTIVFRMEPNMEKRMDLWSPKWIEPKKEDFLFVGYHKEHYNNLEWHISRNYKQLINENITKDETCSKILSTILSSKYSDAGHIKRVDFMKFIEKKGDIYLNIFGSNKFNWKNYKYPLPDHKKDESLFPYKYAFNCENNFTKNYVTEKLIDGILCETLMFYSGCINVKDYIDERAFVYLELRDFEEDYNKIKKAIEEDWWSQRISYIKEAKQKILNELQFFPRLEKIIL